LFYIVKRRGYTRLIIMDSGLDDWIYWHFCHNYSQSQPLTTAHNQWQSKTCFIPSWAMSIFSSTATDLVLTHESVISSASVIPWFTLHSRTLLTNADFCMTEYSSTNASYNWLARMTSVLRITFCEWIMCPFITWCGLKTEHSMEQFVCCNLHIRCHGKVCNPTATKLLCQKRAYWSVVWEWTIRLSDTLVMQTCVNSAATVC
jgi:hypothetical protein